MVEVADGDDYNLPKKLLLAGYRQENNFDKD